MKTGLYLAGGGWGGVVAQSNMTPLHIAYNVLRAVYIYFVFLSHFCHMPTFNTHLVLSFLRVERSVTFTEGFQMS